MVNFAQKMFFTTYALMKDIVTGGSSKKRAKPLEIFGKYLGLLMSILLVMVSVMALIPSIVFRGCLYVILKLIYGKSFGGFLTGIDAMYEINRDAIAINVIVIYHYGNRNEERVKLMESFIETIHYGLYKFGSKIGNFIGFLYYIKDKVKAEDVLVIVDDNEDGYISRNALCDYIEENCKTIKENQMWRLTAFLQPIDRNGKDGGGDAIKRHAFILTIKHSLGDGPSLIGIMKRMLVETIDKDKVETINLKRPAADRPQMKLKNVYVHRNPLTKRLERGALRLKDYSKWHLAIHLETESKYLPIIKGIKQKLNVSFVDVVSAAISSSVMDYVQQRKVKIKTVTAASVVRVHSGDFAEIVSGTYDFKKVANTSGVVAYNIPFSPTELSMRSKILSTRKSSDALKGAVDFFLMYGLLRGVCSYVPVWITRFFCRRFLEGSTVAITNLVGFPRSRSRGCEIDDVFFCVPDFMKIGFLLCIFSYDGRLELALTSAKGYVRNREELQTILDGALHYLDLAEEEILFEDTPICTYI